MKGATIIRWLDLSRHECSFVLTLREVFDDGSPDCLDVYSFEMTDPDGNPPQHSFSTLDEALTFAASAYDAPRNRYVNQGRIQDEYAAYLVEKSQGGR